MKITLLWVSEVWFEPFFRYECHTFNFDFFFLKFFQRPLIWLLCIFFCITTFFKFVKKTFLEFFLKLKFFFVRQKILLRISYMQKVRDPTFWGLKFDTSDVILYKCKNSEFEIDVTPSIYNFFSIFSSSTPTNLPLAHLFCLRRFCQIIAKKR